MASDGILNITHSSYSNTDIALCFMNLCSPMHNVLKNALQREKKSVQCNRVLASSTDVQRGFVDAPKMQYLHRILDRVRYLAHIL